MCANDDKLENDCTPRRSQKIDPLVETEERQITYPRLDAPFVQQHTQWPHGVRANDLRELVLCELAESLGYRTAHFP